MILLALLPVIAFIFLFLLMLGRQSGSVDGQMELHEAFLYTVLLWSGFIALGTELLNLVKGLTTVGIVLLWVGGLISLAILQWKIKSLNPGWQRFTALFKHFGLDWFGRIVLLIILAALFVLLITGFMSPPNIHDVLAYHMSRVMYWVQNRTLNFFPTSNTWQLWMPPFNEFSQLHWQLLSGGDLLSFLPQWYYLAFVMVAVSATAKLLGGRRRAQILAALFIFTVPIVVLQASGAKNDIALAFFVASLLYFVVKAATAELSRLDWVAVGISVALGILTKGTFAPFALPLLLWLLISMLKKGGSKKAAQFAALGLLLVLVFNGPHWVRNTHTFGTPITPEVGRSHMNSRFGVKETLSNLSRHAVVQINGKYGFINEAAIFAVEKVHQWLDMPLFDPLITLGPHEFYYVPNREEVAGNPFHFAVSGILVIIAMFGVMSKKNRLETYPILILSGVALAGAIIFSAVFRWQAWSTRFFILYYVIFAPVFGFVLDKCLPKLVTWGVAFLLVVVMINPLINNYSRAFSWSHENRNNIWRLSRKGLLFANNPNIEGAVLELTYLMDVSQCRTYGLLTRTNVPEYILWASLRTHPKDYFIEHIYVNNVTAKHATPGFDPCGIILFEFTDSGRVDNTGLNLVQRWELDGEYPFSLFLKPDYFTGKTQ